MFSRTVDGMMGALALILLSRFLVARVRETGTPQEDTRAISFLAFPAQGIGGVR
jgi:hypothetical protein